MGLFLHISSPKVGRFGEDSPFIFRGSAVPRGPCVPRRKETHVESDHEQADSALPSTPNPKPQTLNPTSQAPDFKSQTPNPKPSTRNPPEQELPAELGRLGALFELNVSYNQIAEVRYRAKMENLDYSKDFHLKAQARIWPWLA